MASELFIERFHAAIEGTRGTAESAPTHTFNWRGLLTPGMSYLSPNESRGELASMYRDLITRKGCAWTLEGDADVNYLPIILNALIEPNSSPSTPTNGVLTRLWAFVPTMTADDIETLTLWWDLEAQSLISDFGVIDSLTLANDANGEGGLTVQMSGAAGFPADDDTPTPAANIAGNIPLSQTMQIWMDTSSAIGTTEVTGRLVSAQHVITTGATYKYLAAGPASNALDFTNIGRDKSAHNCVTTLVMEIPDMTQYDLFTAGTTVKCRVRHSGSLIESVTPDYYNYVEVDTYGILRFGGWGENVGSNRTISFTIEGRKDATLGAPYRVAVQNARTAL